ncbi:Sodium/hydrogen exchanger family-domain-containing protein [Phellopilus nigrolimitatus]|nr:Sodium/hydrogen exchanger family-domain-containing protein [Phellopilus nigrolimitatus]
MGSFSRQIIALVGRAAAEQGGVISGDNPAAYDPSDPLRLWVIQVAIIILFTQLLSLVLARIRQPRVIAEVIGGVLLGPSVFGRIPNFTATIFPKASIPFLTLTANIGLVFFLFTVGLEIDTRSIRANARAAALISALGLVIPLGLGAAVAVPIYHAFISPDVNFGYFILFVAVAIGITAFPVLCRILTELRLLDTPVGVVALSAGVGNDVVGWILLALTVALVNASSGLTALWVLLTGVAYVLFLLFPVKWAFRWLARRTGSLEGGQPSTLMMTVTLLLVLVSAFFTDIIGIHAIFGGFVAGLIIPHEGGFAIALVEKIEDLISLVFLPLYFTLSGLSTNLGLLDTGKTWAYVVLICVVAFLGKFAGCFATAKLTGFSTREAGAIGTLMSCKGLVELIVLNVGLQAGILDTRTFSMFVLHALVLTFATTPLTLLWYPAAKRTRVDQGTGAKEAGDAPRDAGPRGAFEDRTRTKTNLAVVLSRAEHLPALMMLTQLLQRPAVAAAPSSTPSLASARAPAAPVQLAALRLVALTERTSAVLRSQEAPALAAADALLGVVRACGRLHRVPVAGALAVVPEAEFAQRVAGFVRERAAQMVVLPWTLALSAGGRIEEQGGGAGAGLQNPFEGLFGGSASPPAGAGAGPAGAADAAVYSAFVRRVFAESPADVALFVERAAGADSDSGGNVDGHHLFLPFFGGPDDRLALAFVVQLCANPAVRATVVWVREAPAGAGADEELEKVDTVEREKGAALADSTFSQQLPANADTVYGAQTAQTRLQSATADSLLWARYAHAQAHSATEAAALARIAFREAPASAQPLHAALAALGPGKGEAPHAVVVAGRGRRMPRGTHRTELQALVRGAGAGGGGGGGGEELGRTAGDVAAAFLLCGRAGAVLVVQAAEGQRESA